MRDANDWIELDPERGATGRGPHSVWPELDASSKKAPQNGASARIGRAIDKIGLRCIGVGRHPVRCKQASLRT